MSVCLAMGGPSTANHVPSDGMGSGMATPYVQQQQKNEFAHFLCAF